MDSLKKTTQTVNELSSQLEIKAKELQTYKQLNQELQEQVIDLSHKLQSRDLQLETVKILKDNNSQLEKEINIVIEDLTKQKKENNSLLEEVHSLKKRLSNNEEKYSGENSLEVLHKRISILKEQNSELYSTVDEQKICIKGLENRSKTTNYEIEEYMRKINNEILNINEWIETYFTSFIRSEQEIPELKEFELNCQANSSINNNSLSNNNNNSNSSLYKILSSIKIDSIKKALNKKLKLMIKEFKQINDNLKDERRISNDIQENYSKLTQELSKVKKQNINLELELEKQGEHYKQQLSKTEQKHIYENQVNSNKINFAKQVDEENQSLINNYEIILLKLEEIFIQLKLPKYNLIEKDIKNKIHEMLEFLVKQANDFSNSKFNEKILIEKNNVLKTELLKLKKDSSNLRQMTSDEVSKVSQNIEFLQKNSNKKIEGLESQVLTLKTILGEKDIEINKLITENKNLKMKLFSNSVDNNQNQHMNNVNNVNHISSLSSDFSAHSLKDNNNSNNNNNSSHIDKLERKINNLQREIELKSIQINSQEQMLIRRNNEIEDLKRNIKNNNTNNNTINASLNSDDNSKNIKKMVDLENDKKSLIKDNISLISNNNEMKKMLHELKIENTILKEKINKEIKHR